MGDNKLKTAVLGLNDKGRLLLKVAAETAYFQVQAVADKDTQLAERIAKEYKCTAYDDYRQLIIANQLDCLLVAAGMHNCGEHLQAAIKKKFNILKWPPLARNFEEAAQIVKLAEEMGIKFAVANKNQCSDSSVAFHKFIQEGKIEHVFLIKAVCNAGEDVPVAWHNDRKLSGGGVLLRNCYQIIDQIVSNFHIPQEVYSLNTNTAGDRKQRHYLSEDTTIVTMKFRENLIANLTASKIIGPNEAFLQVFGKDKILTGSNSSLTLKNSLGKIIEKAEYNKDEFLFLKRVLENFALSILSPDKNKLLSSGRENLKNMSVIESSYLSARTGMPESPARVLQLSQIEKVKI